MSPSPLLLLLLLLAGASAQSTGDAECKCIDPWQRNLTMNGVVLSSNASCPWRGTDGTCYPVTYGRSTCTTHDLTVSPTCTAAGRDLADPTTQVRCPRCCIQSIQGKGRQGPWRILLLNS